MQALALVALLFVAASTAGSTAAASPLRVDGSLGFANIQQQAKPQIGTPRGERLVEHTAATVSAWGALDVHRHLAVGLFAELDAGVRRAGELVGFDPDGRAAIDPAIGGSFQEVWAGLGVRGQWRGAFLELGYPLYARRWDSARDDLPAADGGGGAFAPTLTVRWLASIGGRVALSPCLDLVLRLEWRIRYYDERGGQPLMDGIVHGTQEFRPLAGVAWRP